mmetsp:Transcript_12616/g.32409  ORF Transcript_12616/g.32409 Transcript_12616/m.32409 type:complete len:220 (-) Transcript_12616:304-963(-)
MARGTARPCTMTCHRLQAWTDKMCCFTLGRGKRTCPIPQSKAPSEAGITFCPSKIHKKFSVLLATPAQREMIFLRTAWSAWSESEQWVQIYNTVLYLCCSVIGLLHRNSRLSRDLLLGLVGSLVAMVFLLLCGHPARRVLPLARQLAGAQPGPAGVPRFGGERPRRRRHAQELRHQLQEAFGRVAQVSLQACQQLCRIREESLDVHRPLAGGRGRGRPT